MAGNEGQERIPEYVFHSLIRIGGMAGRDEAEMEPLLALLSPWDHINRTPSLECHPYVKALGIGDLVLLIRGLVTVEERLHWLGGSGAAGIWLFRSLERRDIARADELGDWILQNTTNPYLPGGWQRGVAQTMGAYRGMQRRAIERRIQREAESHAEHEAALRRREERIRKGKERERIQKQASMERNELLARLNDLSPTDRIMFILTDSAHVVQYYPDRYARLDQIRGVSSEAKDLLMRRIQHIRRGAWRLLYRQLASQRDPV